MPEALQRFTTALQRFAGKHGASGKYHATITGAYLFLINERMHGDSADATWDAFAATHPELLARTPTILDGYYHAETLRSDRAKQTFLMPDRMA